MKTYITEVLKKTETEYGFYEGPKINALCWDDAAKVANEQGVTLVGKLR